MKYEYVCCWCNKPSYIEVTKERYFELLSTNEEAESGWACDACEEENDRCKPKKVSDRVGLFLADHVRHVFCISGGASLHLIHGIVNAKSAGKDIDIVCPQNEQAASFQADCYARITGMGCALVTSGPGATNLITGIASSWYDSVPVLYVTGQQTRNRLRGNTGVRQIGFQETPIVDIVRPITKYAVTVMEPKLVIAELEKALRIAKQLRPGPVLIDIPDDVQRAVI